MQSQGALKLATFCLIVFVHLACRRRHSAEALDYAYARINNHLVDRVEPSADLVANLNTASEWLQMLQSADQMIGPEIDANSSESLISSRKESIDSSEIPALVEALKGFTQLREIVDPSRCDMEDFQVLQTNDKATEGKCSKAPSKVGRAEGMSRIERLIHESFLRHALHCKRKYPANLAARYRQLDVEAVRRIEMFGDGIIRSHCSMDEYYFTPRQYNEFILNINWIRGERDVESIYRTLRELSHGDPDWSFLHRKAPDQGESAPVVMDKSKLESLFHRYLVEPCGYYVRELGPNLFLPADFDAQLLEEGKRFEPFPDSEEFYAAWARYRICKVLMSSNNQSLIERLLELARESLLWNLNFPTLTRDNNKR